MDSGADAVPTTESDEEGITSSVLPLQKRSAARQNDEGTTNFSYF